MQTLETSPTVLKKRMVVGASAAIVALLHVFSPAAMVWTTMGTLLTNVRLGGEEAGISFSIQEVFLYILAFGFLLYKVQFRLNPVQSRISRDIAVYTLVMSVTTLFNIGRGPAHMLSVVRDTLAPWLWYLLLLNYLVYEDHGSVRKYLIFIIVLGIVSSFVAFLQHFAGKLVIYQGEENRDYLAIAIEGAIAEEKPATGLFLYFNAFGMFVQVAYFVALVYWQMSRKTERKWYLMAVIILLLGEYVSFSRGSYLTLILGTAIILVASSRKWRLPVLIGATGLAFVFAVFVIPFALENQEVLASLFTRFFLWQEGFDYFTRRGNWLYGIGPGLFMQLVGTEYDVHNVYLMHLFENGLPGIFVLILLTYRLLKETLSTFRRTENRELKSVALICFAVFVGYFVHEMIEHTFYSIVFRMTIFTLAALFVRAQNDAKEWTHETSTKFS